MAQENKGAGQQFLFDPEPVIKGFPELRWTGKRPYRSTQYYPAQLRESYGDPSVGPDGKPWMNKIYWGDNLQVMSHLLKDYRGKVDLIYIDPPFDSKADYKKKIKLKKKKYEGDSSAFEEKQYSDIWISDYYLQFMYERVVLMRELLSGEGLIALHCDATRGHYLRCILDEVFGPSNFLNEIIWDYRRWPTPAREFQKMHDNIYIYVKNKSSYYFEKQYMQRSEATEKRWKGQSIVAAYNENGVRIPSNAANEESKGAPMNDVWYVPIVAPSGHERTGYPTQKPEKLIGTIMASCSHPGSLVFDCFMGSGTTQAVAMKLGRRFIGADINLGSIQTTTKRLLGVAKDLGQQVDHDDKYLGFEVYNVNNYDFFRNPVEAKDILVQALDIQPLSAGSCFDGELDGRMVKILPTNRIATRADLEGLVADLPYNIYDARREENPNTPVDHITLVCMGHEPDLKAAFEAELSEYKVDVEIVDVLQDKRELEFKREAEANVAVEGGRLVIKSFYPMNLLQKLSLQKEAVGDWRELVESVMVDWNYDGAVMEPTVIDIPERDEFVAGTYDVPDDAGRIKVKITDVLSESLEVEVGA
jgi:DNA modification methylase